MDIEQSGSNRTFKKFGCIMTRGFLVLRLLLRTNTIRQIFYNRKSKKWKLFSANTITNRFVCVGEIKRLQIICLKYQPLSIFFRHQVAHHQRYFHFSMEKDQCYTDQCWILQEILPILYIFTVKIFEGSVQSKKSQQIGGNVSKNKSLKGLGSSFLIPN